MHIYFFLDKDIKLSYTLYQIQNIGGQDDTKILVYEEKQMGDLSFLGCIRYKAVY